LFFPEIGALGHGNDFRHVLSPVPVKALNEHGPFTAISSGEYYTHALNEKGDLYSWGRGEYQVFGDGYSKSVEFPRLNETIRALREG